MNIAVAKETVGGERRVALVPNDAAKLVKAGHTVLIQQGAGAEAYFVDSAYTAVGAQIVPDAATLFSSADIMLKVQKPTAAEIAQLRSGAVLISFLQSLTSPDTVQALAAQGVSSFGMEAIPRTTRAQSMDALSSQATVAGYKAVLLAADTLGRFLPMLTTAAGTVTPARAFVLGAGVAGLQAIATARRLGAVVEAFDVRPVVKEQVESLGAKFVMLEQGAIEAAGSGGYAKELSEEQHRQEVALLAKHAKDSDLIITTAAIPGRKAPVLITAEMVPTMKPGSVIVDLAAETGGNCELTQAGQTIVHSGVIIMGPLNVPSMLPFHASQMYSKNVSNLLALLMPKAELNLNFEDDIIAGTCITHGGQVVHAATQKAMQPPPVAVAGGASA
ncbi:MAG: Re/Si-specific NAD(P)(+) transhydrogenase subunit alpha [Chloroflexota bacterium]|nr:Re/Si-specific NAD(P)(+) transhydrogenase subunit alpha [Chloroflexota bacterium]